MFAFSQIDPRISGQVTDMEVPISRYLGASFEEGRDNSMFSSIQKWRETSLVDSDPTSRVLSPEEANNRFALPGLKWDHPVKENVASIMQTRRQAELNRQFFLGQDNHTLVAGIVGMGAQMLGSLSNPLDLGSLFIPFVGEAEVGANVMGRGALRTAISRGLISHEAVAEMFPRTPGLAKSLIQGMAYQGMAQTPVIANRVAEGGKPGIEDLESIGIGGAFAGAMHLGISALGRLFRSLSPEAHEAMGRKALDDFVKGDAPAVDPIAKVELATDQSAIAMRNRETGEIVKSPMGIHAQFEKSPDEWESGFITKDGRFETKAEREVAIQEVVDDFRRQKSGEPSADQQAENRKAVAETPKTEPKMHDATPSSADISDVKNDVADLRRQIISRDEMNQHLAEAGVETSKKEPEKIVASAIKLKDGTILKSPPGGMHGDVEGLPDDFGIRDNPDDDFAEAGFVTKEGRFISGEEAAALTGKTGGSEEIFSQEEYEAGKKQVEPVIPSGKVVPARDPKTGRFLKKEKVAAAEEPEKIVAAAMRKGTDVRTGVIHPMIDVPDSWYENKEAGIPAPDVEMGFTTSSGRFVDREEAANLVGEPDLGELSASEWHNLTPGHEDIVKQLNKAADEEFNKIVEQKKLNESLTEELGDDYAKGSSAKTIEDAANCFLKHNPS